MTWQHDLWVKNLKNESNAFNTVEEEDWGQVEGEEGRSCGFNLSGRLVSPNEINRKLELTQPLYCTRHDGRTKTSSSRWKSNTAQHRASSILPHTCASLCQLFLCLRPCSSRTRSRMKSREKVVALIRVWQMGESKQSPQEYIQPPKPGCGLGVQKCEAQAMGHRKPCGGFLELGLTRLSLGWPAAFRLGCHITTTIPYAFYFLIPIFPLLRPPES